MHLLISLLGPFSATVGEEQIPISRTKKIEALLAYLVVERDHAHRRENLMGLLFPEMADDAASTNLRQTLTRLRRAVKDSAATPAFLTITRETVQFNAQSDHWCDLLAFESLRSGCTDHGPRQNNACSFCMAKAQEAVALYRGPFLIDFFLADSAAFEDWAAAHRARFQQDVLAMLDALTRFHSRRGEYAQAIAYGQRQLEIEPWQEEAHAEMMRLLARVGRRTEALAQYKRCEEALRIELDVDPSPSTIALRDQIAEIAEHRPHNLLVPDATFIGRDDELAHIYAHFADDTARLLTLVGTGGVGKTRLALEAGWRTAQEFLGPFMHGIYFVSLGEIGIAIDAEQMLLIAIAESLGLSLVGIQSPLNLILGHVQDKELLLIVDNCEEASSAVTVLSKLLSHAPGLQILATSREPLELANEFLMRIDGLSFPVDVSGPMIPDQDADQASGEPIGSKVVADDAGNESPSDLAHDSSDDSIDVEAGEFITTPSIRREPTTLETYQSVQLFAHHARRVEADFDLNDVADTEQQAIARICQLCAGMPLALEMAAVWVELLPCEEIATEIEQNFDILQSRSHQHVQRHYSIGAVFDYSWQRLSPAERTLFGQLSVFRGGFDRRAAQEITEMRLPMLAELVRKSLLNTVKSKMHDQKRPQVRCWIDYCLFWKHTSLTARKSHSVRYRIFMP
ncbi:hypothetical protein KFU94_60315 [Chloroflexi bacterium TSY]|nr:hypothetical protein [Chloroflexi bacterium TSY]